MNDSPLKGVGAEAVQIETGHHPSADSRPASDIIPVSLSRSLEGVLLLVIVLAAVALRLWYSSRMPLESDEAIVGLMARHILEGRPMVFYYGQAYMGALEAYLVAALFGVLGPSVAAMRLVPLAASVLFTVLLYILGRRLYGPRVALASALYVGVSPLFLTIWSVKVRGGYPEVLAFGTLILLLLLDIAYRSRAEVWRLALLGFVAGLAFWTNQLVLPFLGIFALFALVRLGPRVVRLAGVVVPFFLLGSLPFWIPNVRSGFSSLRTLSRMGAADAFTVQALFENVRDFLKLSGPVLLGFSEPRETIGMRVYLAAGIPLSFVLSWIVEAGLLLLIAYYVVGVARLGWRGFVEREDVPLLALGLLIVVGFCSTYYIPRWLGEPRQFILLYTVVPLLVAQMARITTGSRVPAILAISLAMVVNIGVTLGSDPLKATIELDSVPVPADVGQVVRYLVDNGDTAIRGDYWIVYRLAFESDERVVGLAIDETYGPHPFTNRYPPYVEQVNASPKQVYVFLLGTPTDHDFESLLRSRGIGYRRAEVGGFAVYDELDQPERIRQQ